MEHQMGCHWDYRWEMQMDPLMDCQKENHLDFHLAKTMVPLMEHLMGCHWDYHLEMQMDPSMDYQKENHWDYR